MNIATLNSTLSFLTIICQIFILILVLFTVTNTGKRVTGFIATHGLFLGFLISIGATVGSFIYSDIIGFAPCTLCWYQRALLFPQGIILAIAAWRKDQSGALYGLILSIAGAIIAAYNSYLQMGGHELFPCAATGPSCAQRFVFEYGYITIPMMALTTFLLLSIVHTLHLKTTQSIALNTSTQKQ